MSRPMLLPIATLAALGAAGCGDRSPLPPRDLALTITAGSDAEFGRAFPLTIEREWSVELTPEPWRDEALAPLRIVPRSTERRSDGQRILETRHLRAWSFVAGRVELKAVPFHATDRAGATRSVASAPLAIEVRTTLADPSTPPELPEGLRLPPPLLTATRLAIGAALLLTLLGAWIVVRRRRRGAVPVAATVTTAGSAPRERALARLARLRTREPDDDAALQAFHVEAAALLKEYVAEGFALPVLQRTTEEIAARPNGDLETAELARLLARCDRVKFARAGSDAAARSEWLDGAVRFVEASR